MGEIELPWLPADLSSGDAVDWLVSASTPGVTRRPTAIVTEKSGDLVLITVDSIVAAAQEDMERLLGDVEPAEPVLTLPRTIRNLQEMTGTDIEGLLDEAGASFATSPGQPRLLRLVTRHEGLAAQFSAQRSICCCTGPRRHAWLAEQVPDGQCRKCPNPVLCN